MVENGRSDFVAILPNLPKFDKSKVGRGSAAITRAQRTNRVGQNKPTHATAYYMRELVAQSVHSSCSTQATPDWRQDSAHGLHMRRAHLLFVGCTNGAAPQPHTEPKPVVRGARTS